MSRFSQAFWYGVAGLLMFASVIYDMELPPVDVQRFVAVSFCFGAYAAYHLARGLNEKQNKRKAQNEAASSR